MEGCFILSKANSLQGGDVLMREEIQPIINQKGALCCPICRKKFDWEYKFGLLHNVDWNLGVTTVIEGKHSSHISFITADDDKVQFHISCPKCLSVHQTRPMEMNAK